MIEVFQAMAGAAIGYWLLGKRLGHQALVWGAILGLAPDVDRLLGFLLSTSHALFLDAGPTHSLLGIIVAAYGGSFLLAKYWRSLKWSRAQCAKWIGLTWSMHIAIELLSTNGVALLWPISMARIAFPCYDHLTCSVVCIPLAWAIAHLIIKGKKLPFHLQMVFLARGSLFTVGILIFMISCRVWVTSQSQQALKQQEISYSRMLATPLPLSPLIWRVLIEQEDAIHVSYRSVFEGSASPSQWTIYPRQRDVIETYQKNREIKSMLHATSNWWIVRPHTKGLFLVDMRSSEARIWGKRIGMVDSQMHRSWLFLKDRKKDRLWPMLAAKRCSMEYLNRLLKRTFLGDRSAWEANPRLANTPGSLPELLPSR